VTQAINVNNIYLKILMSEYKQNQEPKTINFRELVSEIKSTDRATHFIHKYPAKLLQHIPYYLFKNDLFSQKGDTVFDPFMGSGTVLLEGILASRNVIGTDINPLAVLISKVKTRQYDVNLLEAELNNITHKYKKIRKTKFQDPKVINLDHWYDDKTILMLSRLKKVLLEIEDNEIKEFFQVAFSTCIRKYSYADPRVSVPVKINTSRFADGHWLKKHALDHLRHIKEFDLIEYFEEVSRKNIQRFLELSEMLKNEDKSSVIIFDKDVKALTSKDIKDESVDLIVTSPPYVSAQKYIRSSRLNIEWLGLGEEETKYYDQKSIGREHIQRSELPLLQPLGNNELDTLITKIGKKNMTRAHITLAYMIEMKKTFIELYRVLKNHGYFTMVMGNNTIAGIEFETEKFLRQIAEEVGFETKLVLIDDIKSRGLMTKRNKTASTISREYVVIFQKVAK